MAVYKDKRTGHWYFRFQKDGIPHVKYFPDATRQQVMQYEAELRSALNDDKYGILKKKYMLSQAIKAYKDYCKVNYITHKKQEYIIDMFFKIIGEKELKDVNKSDIENYRKERMKKVSNSSINREIDNIRKCFSLAVENEIINKNPCKNIRKLRVENKVERYLTKDEEKKLLEVSNPILRLMILIALYTGMRLGEILNLKWNDIDFNGKYIAVLKTKNGKRRNIPLNNMLKKELMSFKRISEYVFTNPVTMKRYTTIHKTYERAVKNSKIPHITFHQLRHTFATRLVNSGVDIVIVQRLLGHSSLNITQRYAHPVSETMIDAVNKI